MSLILANIWGLIFAHWKIALTIAVTVIVLLLILINSFCGGDSATEQRINDRIPEIIEHRAEVNAAANVANQAVMESNMARKQLDKVKKQKPVNVDYEVGNQQRCLAFPESSECAK